MRISILRRLRLTASFAVAMPLLVVSLATRGQSEETKRQSFLELDIVRGDVLLPNVGRTSLVAAAEAVAANADSAITHFRISRSGAARNLEVVGFGESLRPGDTVEIEFGVKRDGFVSIWSKSAENEVKRVVPNKHMSGAVGNAVHVRSGEPYRIASDGRLVKGGEAVGRTGKPWHIRVREPYGSAEVYLRWSEAESSHLPEAEDTFVDLESFGRALEPISSENRKVHSVVIGYEVVRP